MAPSSRLPTVPLGQNGYLRLLDTTENKIAESWRAHSDTIFDFDFSPDGAQLVTAGGDKLIKVWELASKKELARLEGHSAQVLGVAFNSNATQVVSGGVDKEIKVWDIKTREKIISLGSHSDRVTALVWPAVGNVIIAATDGGDVSSYSNLKAHTGEQSSSGGDEKKLGNAEETVVSLATSRDAKMLFAGTHDGVVHVWNSEGKLLTKLLRPTNETALVAMAPAAVRNGRPGKDARISDRKKPLTGKPGRATTVPAQK